MRVGNWFVASILAGIILWALYSLIFLLGPREERPGFKGFLAIMTVAVVIGVIYSLPGLWGSVVLFVPALVYLLFFNKD